MVLYPWSVMHQSRKTNKVDLHGSITMTKKLWMGVGLTPGNAEDMYSGRAKALGMLAGLLFIRYYISCYNPDQYTETCLNCFCDKQGILRMSLISLQALHAGQ